MTQYLELHTPDVIVEIYKQAHWRHSVEGLLYWASCNGIEQDGLEDAFNRLNHREA